MPPPTNPTSFPPIFPVAARDRARLPQPAGSARVEEGGVRILAAILAVVVACAFVVDVGVPAKRPPAPAPTLAALP